MRGKGLTKQLLTFARGGAPVKKSILLYELIVDATSFVLRGSKNQCTYAFAKDLWAVEADEGQLSQVAQNLVINASQAMPNGGAIAITAANRTLTTGEISPLPAGRFVELTFHDQGHGIAPEHLSLIFDPYFSSKREGTGLGLAISYSIIKKHGGLITVDSERDKGAKFSIFLPAMTTHLVPNEQQALEQQALVHTIRSKKTWNILIMDDDKIVRDIVKAMLAILECNVEEVSNGKAAIDAFIKAKDNQTPFDCVIMDLIIPGGMGGKETIAALLAIEPTVKVIASSGYANDPIMANYKAYGFCEILPKPFSFDNLKRILAAVSHQTQKN